MFGEHAAAVPAVDQTGRMPSFEDHFFDIQPEVPTPARGLNTL
jgi:hypothetical protein